jgi:hypothetical protein
VNRRGQIGALGAMLALSLSGMLAPPPLAAEIERQKRRDEEAARERLLQRMGIKPGGLDQPPFPLTREMVADAFARVAGDEAPKMALLFKDRPITPDLLRQAEVELYSRVPVYPAGPPLLLRASEPTQVKSRPLAERKARRAKRKQRRNR